MIALLCSLNLNGGQNEETLSDQPQHLIGYSITASHQHFLSPCDVTCMAWSLVNVLR